jgi:hypothetical protein
MSVATVDIMPSSLAVEKYLDEMRLLRKPLTVVSAQQVLEEYLNFADPHDIRAGVLRWLAWCQDNGNSTRTLAAKRTRIQCFYSASTSTSRSRGSGSLLYALKFSLKKNSISSSRPLKAVDTGFSNPSCRAVSAS